MQASVTALPNNGSLSTTLPRDLTAGLVVFLVALPLCLGVALASGAPLLSGVLAGIIGGILVGILSGSHTSVSGPSPGVVVVVAAQIIALGSFKAFLLAVLVAGLIQIILGLVRAGFIAAFFPSSVIKGLLTAIGVILILKQLPHVVGHDPDPQGEMAFQQPDHQNTFSELVSLFAGFKLGAAVVGFASLALLLLWDRWHALKRLPLPAPLLVVVVGIVASAIFKRIGGAWVIDGAHLVQVPVPETVSAFFSFLQLPDFSQWMKPAIYSGAITIAAVTSLETLLNLEAVDQIDPQRRTSPASRELVAQGIGNILSGLVGGLPITSVVVRSSVNINAGARTKLATIFHGILLMTSVVLLPAWLNMIPISCLAAILFVTGLKLASPAIVKQMWTEGRYQFLPFAATVIAIVLTDLVVGVLIGMGVSVAFILYSNMRRPLRLFVEKHLGGDVLHIELANQVSFLNRAALSKALGAVRRGGHVLLDAQNTDYIDPDVLDLIREFTSKTGPARGVEVSLLGFRNRYELRDQTQYVDYSTRELQDAILPQQVLQILKDGNARFRSGRQLTRNLTRQVIATARGQHPLAVVLSCIDSRTPAELVLDLGVGDIFSVRIAGNVLSRKVLGSIEYGCAVAGAKLVLVMGHTRCGAVTEAVKLVKSPKTAAELTGCQHIDFIVTDIQEAIATSSSGADAPPPGAELTAYVDSVARRNVSRVVQQIREQSAALAGLVREGRIEIVGAMYDVGTGQIEFIDVPANGAPPEPRRVTAQA